MTERVRLPVSDTRESDIEIRVNATGAYVGPHCPLCRTEFIDGSRPEFVREVDPVQGEVDRLYCVPCAQYCRDVRKPIPTPSIPMTSPDLEAVLTRFSEGDGKHSLTKRVVSLLGRALFPAAYCIMLSERLSKIENVVGDANTAHTTADALAFLGHLVYTGTVVTGFMSMLSYFEVLSHQKPTAFEDTAHVAAIGLALSASCLYATTKCSALAIREYLAQVHRWRETKHKQEKTSLQK